MIGKLSGFAVKFRWMVIIFWVLLTGVIVFNAPVLSEVAKGDQSSFLPEDSSAVKASEMIKRLYPEQGGGSSIVLTLNRKSGINGEDREFAKELEEYLNHNKSTYKIRDIVSPFSQAELEGSMISEDKEAALMILNLTVPGYKDITGEVVNAVRAEVQGKENERKSGLQIPGGLSVNVTGDAPLGFEQIDNVHKSMELTTKITIFLVVLILIIIYRSPVAFWVPLLTIGTSFLVSRGLIAILTNFGLKVSSFTETFLIAVLFGAGTDYCLLMISRFREELLSGKPGKEALSVTLPNTGIAILSSGGTVIVGFLAMISAKFGLFNTTGPSIALGVGITLIAVMTLTPAIISLFGEKLFWPAHPSRLQGKRAGKETFWSRLAGTVTSKPAMFIFICLIAALPFLISVKGVSRSFDQLAELPAGSDAVKGFDVIKEHFNQGEMLPVKVVLEDNKDMWSNETLKVVDDIAKNIDKVDGVAKVRTATRPLGEKITETTLPAQIEKLSGGLGQAGDGFEPIINGLDAMENGIKEIAGGVAGGSGQLEGLLGATRQTSEGISKVNAGLKELSKGAVSSEEGIAGINKGLNTLADGVSGSKNGLIGASAAVKAAQESLEAVLGKQPALAGDPDFQRAYGTVKAVLANMSDISAGLDEVNSGLLSAQSSISRVGSGLQSIDEGIRNSDAALQRIRAGLNTMETGQEKAIKGLNAASDNLLKIASQVKPGKKGLEKIRSGLTEAEGAAKGYTNEGNVLGDVFYLPEGALDKYPELKDAMGFFIAPGGKGITFEVILSVAPYSKEALDSISKINDAVSFSLKDTALENAEFHIGGSTPAISEMRDITSEDFTKVMFFVLLGIFIVLMLMLRSIIAPLYLILTIILSFATTMGISYLVFQVLLGHDGLTWSVPFFSFCLLVALGVDYNIFLMSRVKEEYVPGDVKGGVARALSSTGGIITSCGIIMAGTFGAFIASPVTQLVEIGFATVVGLLLDTFIIRCLLVPAIAVKVGELNWWPGKKVKVVSAGNAENVNAHGENSGIL